MYAGVAMELLLARVKGAGMAVLLGVKRVCVVPKAVKGGACFVCGFGHWLKRQDITTDIFSGTSVVFNEIPAWFLLADGSRQLLLAVPK